MSSRESAQACKFQHAVAERRRRDVSAGLDDYEPLNLSNVLRTPFSGNYDNELGLSLAESLHLQTMNNRFMGESTGIWVLSSVITPFCQRKARSSRCRRAWDKNWRIHANGRHICAARRECARALTSRSLLARRANFGGDHSGPSPMRIVPLTNLPGIVMDPAFITRRKADRIFLERRKPGEE